MSRSLTMDQWYVCLVISDLLSLSYLGCIAAVTHRLYGLQQYLFMNLDFVAGVIPAFDPCYLVMHSFNEKCRH